tara:strand:- start:1071 stop:1904 length:834 start_codon:yes stop_codon:yes gene_type:complete
MSETQQSLGDSMLNDSMEEITKEEQAEQQANPEVIEDVLVETADPLDTQTVASEEEPTEYVRPEYFPDKFWNDEDGPDIEGLVKSYSEMEKNFSQGKHKAPEAYDVKFAEDKGISTDDGLLGKFQGWAKEHGVSQAAFESLANDYIDSESQQLEQFNVDAAAEKAKLGPNADDVIRSTAQWADGLFKKGVLNENELEAFKQTGATADGIRALQKVRRFYGEATIPVAQPNVEGLPTADELYEMVGKEEYKTDATYRNKVQKMFKQRFPDNPDTDYII